MKTLPKMVDADVVIVGSGVAGMTTALDLEPLRVVLLTKTKGLSGGASPWAQGGVAAAIGADDSPARHALDTIRAGAGLNNAALVAILTDEGPVRVNQLINRGMRFDRDARGRLLPQKEAAHDRERVLRANGDATGAAMVSVLSTAIAARDHIEVHDRGHAWDLIIDERGVRGLLAFQEDLGWVCYRTRRVVLATGGVGQLFRLTTNPAAATGDGLAMALRAGARCADLEFMQFHPTALAVPPGPEGNAPLLTEALRGEGAVLLDRFGNRFMPAIHPDAELAPRDIVARAVWRETLRGGAFLDARQSVGAAFPTRFPTVYRACVKAGLDPIREIVPVAPAAHYYMGGVLTDGQGKTSIPGLWACGEVAATGVHGANRLASNSLLECLVFGARVAVSLKSLDRPLKRDPFHEFSPPAILPETTGDQVFKEKLARVMYDKAGLIRSGPGLREIFHWLSEMDRSGAIPNTIEAQNLRLIAEALAFAANRREESRGAHFREDYPMARPHLARRHILTIHDIQERPAAYKRKMEINP